MLIPPVHVQSRRGQSRAVVVQTRNDYCLQRLLLTWGLGAAAGDAAYAGWGGCDISVQRAVQGTKNPWPSRLIRNGGVYCTSFVHLSYIYRLMLHGSYSVRSVSIFMYDHVRKRWTGLDREDSLCLDGTGPCAVLCTVYCVLGNEDSLCLDGTGLCAGLGTCVLQYVPMETVRHVIYNTMLRTWPDRFEIPRDT